MSTRKRLSKPIQNEVEDLENLTQDNTELIFTPYSEKSFVITGSKTIEHSKALVDLGGKFNHSLRVGPGWIFSKTREESVRKYIQTGEIIPYVWNKEQFVKEKRKAVHNNDMFNELRNAFDLSLTYKGNDIISVIDKIEQKYNAL